MSTQEPAAQEPASRVPRGRARRLAWFLAGCVAVAVGLAGIALPVVLAAACFARSSERAERWVLALPGVGRMVADHRAGLGMPRRAKVIAIAMIAVAVSISALVLGSWPLRIVVLALGAIGIGYVGWRVPTRERVLAQRAAAAVYGRDQQR